MSARCIRITGKVQGVGFRASTRHQALQLGLKGYAKNLADGSVEVMLEGDAQAIEEMLGWLAHGPSLARVDAVDEYDSSNENQTYPTFCIE